MRISDWSSDVCSSDLRHRRGKAGAALRIARERRDALDLVALIVAQLQHNEEAAERRHDIDEQIGQHAFDPLLRPRRQADQHIADVVDRRIGKQALDILLPDRADRAEDDRGERQEDYDLLPRADCRSEEHTSEPKSLMPTSYAV